MNGIVVHSFILDSVQKINANRIVRLCGIRSGCYAVAMYVLVKYGTLVGMHPAYVQYLKANVCKCNC